MAGIAEELAKHAEVLRKMDKSDHGPFSEEERRALAAISLAYLTKQITVEDTRKLFGIEEGQ